MWHHNPPLLPYDFHVVPSPELPVRDADDPGGPETVVRAVVREMTPRGVRLDGTTKSGQPLSVQVEAVTANIVHVVLTDAREAPDPLRATLARDLSAEGDVRVAQEDGAVQIRTEGLRVHIALDPFRMAYYDAGGRLLLEQNNDEVDAIDSLRVLPFGFSEVGGQRAAFHDGFTAQPDEHFYGFGEKFTEFDKRGQWIDIWNHNTYGVHTEKAYKNVPFFISSRGYGMFVDSTTQIQFDMAASNHAVFQIIVPDTALDYYVIAGGEPKALITRYSELTSMPILPPKWAFGFWMSSGFGPDSAEATLERARKLREHEIPCDVLHLDTFWQRDRHWSDLVWDAETFPDPPGMLDELDRMGFKVSLWINPYLSHLSERFKEADERGYLLKRADGSSYVIDLWQGFQPPVGIIDFTNPEAVAWYKDALRGILQDGADVFKTDFGEEIPADVVAHNGMTGKRLHNIYPLLFNDAVSEVSGEVTGRAGIVWARASYAGGQRHVFQWGADTKCTYTGLASTLRGGLSIGMCGHTFWGHDIGGFHTQPTPDLYIRWVQFGMFSPVARAHGVTTRLPWDYGEEAVRITREFVRLRYHLLPYLYTQACEAVETSHPILRPMLVEFPDDLNTYSVDLQYMLGPDMLVAPIYNVEGRRPVYFPAGRWVDLFSHEVIKGPIWRTFDVPLDRFPVYVRGDALIPTTPVADHIGDGPFEPVVFDGYLLDKGSFTLRDTDGATTLAAAFEGTTLALDVAGAKAWLGFRLIPLPGQPAVERVVVNGRPVKEVSEVDLQTGKEEGWCTVDGGMIAMIHNEGPSTGIPRN